MLKLLRVVAALAAIAALSMVLISCGEDEVSGDTVATGATAAAADETAAESDADLGEPAEPIAIDDDAAPLTKRQYIRRADALCERIKDEIIKSAIPQENRKSLERFNRDLAAGVNEILIPSLEKEITELSALGAPPGDEEQVEAMLGEFQAVVDHAKADPEGFAQLDTTNPKENPYRKADKLAGDYGLNACPRT